MKKIIPKGMGVPLLLILAYQLLVYSGSRLINTPLYHYNMSVPLDGRIPLIPWTVSIYVLSYPFWVANYILGARQGRKEAFRFLTADFVAKTISLAFFLFLPTTCTRPEIVGTGFWNWVLKIIYAVDTPDNLFPSLHCLASWISYIAVRKNEAVPKWYRVFTLVFALMICVSTVTTRQHVLLDIPAGLAIAELSYHIGCRTGLSQKVDALFSGCKI